jgi:hypothetical protein
MDGSDWNWLHGSDFAHAGVCRDSNVCSKDLKAKRQQRLSGSGQFGGARLLASRCPSDTGQNKMSEGLRITSIRFRNYKAFRDYSIGLNPFNVFCQREYDERVRRVPI